MDNRPRDVLHEGNQRMREARKAANMSQSELAQKTGVTKKTISAIELGDYDPSMRLCSAICKALGKTPDELFWEQ